MEVVFTAGFIMSVDHMGPAHSEEGTADFYQSFQSNRASKAFGS